MLQVPQLIDSSAEFYGRPEVTVIPYVEFLNPTPAIEIAHPKTIIIEKHLIDS